MPRVSRRDFLKIAGSASAGMALSRVPGLLAAPPSSTDGTPGIIILVFDAMSARHLSLYGYARQTSPNFERMARRSTVFHAHYSGGNFTTPGTASMLTGLYPWHHRAMNISSVVARNQIDRNIFAALGSGYFRLAFTQNPAADLFLMQFDNALERHLLPTAFGDEIRTAQFGEFFRGDSLIATYAFDHFLFSSKQFTNPVPGSALFGYARNTYDFTRTPVGATSVGYPYGIPYTGLNYFHIGTVMDGALDVMRQGSQPTQPLVGYFHFFFPHAPYNPSKEFVDIFPAIQIPAKQRHRLAGHVKQAVLDKGRNRYDQYVANVDAEFGRLYDLLEASGILARNYLVVTSDHGELFERGELGHSTALLFDPIIHIPLLVSAPGQQDRNDVFVPTSNTDLVPTVLSLAGKSPPADSDGRVLPGLGGVPDLARSIFAIEAKENSAFKPLTRATVSLIKRQQKLIYYTGYPEYPEKFELFDLDADIEEIDNLYSKDQATAAAMREELLDSLEAANKPFRRG